MKCRICGSKCEVKHTALIMGKYKINYYLCNECNFLQAEEPYWLEESYANPINNTDTGLVSRNISLAKKTSIILYYLFGKKGMYLDYGGGYGLFTRLMRDRGFDFYWQDSYTENLLSKGFEYKKTQKIDAITAFELFEHLVDPVQEIEKMLKISRTIIFSTNFINLEKDTPKNWWYFGTEHGQHVAFYTKETLQYLACKYGLNLYTNESNYHILTDQNINKVLFKVLLKIGKSEFLSKRIISLKSKTLEDASLIMNKK